MYTRIDVIGDAESRAETVAFRDRQQYQKFVELAEHFASERGLVVCGPAATRLVLAGDAAPAVGFDSFQYDFFCDNAPATARALADALYALDPEGLGHYTSMLTKEAGQRLAVSVNGRELFTFAAAPTHRGVRAVDLILPVTKRAQFARDANGAPTQLRCIGPESQLLGLYAELCDSAQAAGWAERLTAEAGLRALLGQHLRPRLLQARHGAGADTGLGGLTRRLRERYAAGPGRVVVGAVALALLAGRPPAGRLQVLAASALEDEARDIEKLAGDMRVTWRVEDPNLPMEPRLRRLSVFATIDNRREPILDVFNAAGFESVPYTMVGVYKLGTLFVLMRFRLIDIWTMRLLLRMNAVNEAFARSTLVRMLADYDLAGTLYTATLRKPTEDAAAALFPIENRIGRREDQSLALKRAAQASGRFFAPYFPASRAARAPLAAPSRAAPAPATRLRLFAAASAALALASGPPDFDQDIPLIARALRALPNRSDIRAVLCVHPGHASYQLRLDDTYSDAPDALQHAAQVEWIVDVTPDGERARRDTGDAITAVRQLSRACDPGVAMALKFESLSDQGYSAKP